MSGLMAGKRGLIMGLANDKSIAWGIARACAEAGAELAFSYQGDALKKRGAPLADELGAFLAGHCDVTDDATVDAVFAEVEARFGAPRLAILPIGAYRPRRFLARMHMSPEEAARAHRALRAEESLGVHWGTFQLSDEGRLDPLRDLRAALRPGERFYTLAHGAAREVP